MRMYRPSYAPKYTTDNIISENICSHKSKSAAYRQALLDGVPTPALLADRAMTVTHANRAAAALLGKEAVVGAPVDTLRRNVLSLRVTPLWNARGECDGAFIDVEVTLQQ